MVGENNCIFRTSVMGYCLQHLRRPSSPPLFFIFRPSVFLPRRVRVKDTAMAISKTFLKTRPACKVRFELSCEEAKNAATVHLAGDFNNWDCEACALKRRKDGSFQTELSLDSGQDYRFRYLLNSGEWINDPAADAYGPCEFAGTDNSIAKT